jgi:hypothetical protein
MSAVAVGTVERARVVGIIWYSVTFVHTTAAEIATIRVVRSAARPRPAQQQGEPRVAPVWREASTAAVWAAGAAAAARRRCGPSSDARAVVVVASDGIRQQRRFCKAETAGGAHSPVRQPKCKKNVGPPS